MTTTPPLNYRLEITWYGVTRKAGLGYEGQLRAAPLSMLVYGPGGGWWFRLTRRGIERKLDRVLKRLNAKEKALRAQELTVRTYRAPAGVVISRRQEYPNE